MVLGALHCIATSHFAIKTYVFKVYRITSYNLRSKLSLATLVTILKSLTKKGKWL